MKNMQKVLLMMAIVFTCGAYTSMAQIYVKIRPDRPHYERTAAPSPHHVWVDEEWEPRGNSYAFTGGHWSEPPHGHTQWRQGHWKHNDYLLITND